MKLTYYGHSCLGVEIKGEKMLFDPFITYHELAKDVKPESIEVDFIDCKTVVGVHYNTFGSIKINETEASKTFSASGKKLLLPAITETIDI
jgi:L-ascorbate metabolism protein UlaG (beta-lactamase superfamily)